MRAEAKIALLVVLVVIAVAVLYFTKRNSEAPVNFGQQASSQQIEPKVPLLPTSSRRPGRTPPTSTKPTRKLETAKPTPATQAVITLGPVKPITPSRRSPQPFADTGVRANQPVKIEIDVAATKPAATQPRLRSPQLTIKQRIYIVKPGDTLSAIAQTHYGRTDLWRIIAQANPKITDPAKLTVGQKLTIPPTTRPTQRLTTNRDTPPKGLDRSAVRLYTVKSGESFYTIARDQLGSSQQWRELFEMNKSRVGDDPKKLKVGQTIFIPRR